MTTATRFRNTWNQAWDSKLDDGRKLYAAIFQGEERLRRISDALALIAQTV